MSKIEITAREIKVSINSVPHLLLKRRDVIGFQSWIRSIGAAKPIYFIEVTMTGGQILCDYDDRALWEQILTGLSDGCLFDQRIGEKD